MGQTLPGLTWNRAIGLGVTVFPRIEKERERDAESEDRHNNQERQGDLIVPLGDVTQFIGEDPQSVHPNGTQVPDTGCAERRVQEHPQLTQ